MQTIDSQEVANMVGKTHKELLRDIRRYCGQLNESNIALVDFFKESTYKDTKGESRPCFLVSKKGCEFIAHKLTGTKGSIFTARYINRFHEMEDIIKSPKVPQPRGKQVVDIPENRKAQKLLEELRKEIAGLEVLMNLYNRYQSEEAYKRTAYMLREVASQAADKAFSMCLIEPKMIEKV